MSENDLYYRQRIADELAAADAAKDTGVSSIHRDMAQLYRDLISVEPGKKLSNVEPGTTAT